MDTESQWWELAGIIFFTFMVVTVGLLWGLAIKASYNEEKMKQKQNQKENQDGK
ncbi:hypothetical protein [Hydrogenothermus marinus]|uniref:Uncharacterized protein n=1 Tax=Hydrogenothermus marinus TaxID=133270 RepID=A0A3M0BI85_9AQUI|nr:hypothetical protein [Hydrogenothermus marinus]RMA97133.1 hypothetical protein CLV39_0788 [Hydrogenothermus marinus]